MKYIPAYALLLTFVFCTSFKEQNKGPQPKDVLSKDAVKSSTKDVITSRGPNNITRTIKQDRNGNIWIASLEGVIRYDGTSFTNVTSKVTSRPFVALLEDCKGNFWFASAGAGVYHYDGKSFRNFTTREGLANDRVNCMYEDKAGNIWFGTRSGASCYDGKSFRNYRVVENKTWNSFVNFIPGEGTPDNNVNSIMEDKTGKLWFGTGSGAYVYDGKTFTILTHRGQPFKNVRSILADTKGNIWLGGQDGLWRYDGRTFTNAQNIFTNVAGKFVDYVYEDKNGNIWTSSIGPSTDWVLSRYNVNSSTGEVGTATEIKPKKATMLFGILEHKDGSIWFDTRDGVYRYDGNSCENFGELVVAVQHGGC